MIFVQMQKVFPFENVPEVKKNLCRPTRPALPRTEIAFCPYRSCERIPSESNVRAQGRQEATTVNPCLLVSSAGMVRFLKFLGCKQRALATI